MKLDITFEDIKKILNDKEIIWDGDIAIFEDKILKSSYKAQDKQRFPLSQTKTLVVGCSKLSDEKTYLIDVNASKYNFFIGKNDFSFDYQDYLLENKQGYLDELNSYFREKIADNVESIEYLYKEIARLKKQKDFSKKVNCVNTPQNIDYLIDRDIQHCIELQKEKEKFLNRYKELNCIKTIDNQEEKTYNK